MRILADENVFEPIIHLLRQKGHEVISVRDSDLSGMPDDFIYKKAITKCLTIVTMDKDFSRMARFRPDRCAGIIVIKIYRRSVSETVNLFLQHFEKLDKKRIIGNLVIINPDGARIRSYQTEA